ncbi:MAG TPA: hypothetical protein PKN48_01110 [Bacteroidales bacterium]|nr:hypothetical protein [Bacteroidales bacterium]
MNLLIDDRREYNVDYIARTFEQGINILRTVFVDHLYLDHDYGQDDFAEIDKKRYHRDGVGILRWLSDNPQFKPGRITIVSDNPVGIDAMRAELRALDYEETMGSWWA